MTDSAPVLLAVDAMPPPVRVGRHWLFIDGSLVPVIAGGNGEGEGGEGQGSEGGGVGTQAKPEPKIEMTQAQIDAQAAGIRKEAERTAKKQAEKALADSLGVSVDEAKQIIADQKAAKEAAQSESEKAVNAAKTREEAATARERAAIARERAAEVKLALMDAGINPTRLARATTLLVTDVAEDADAEAIKAAAEALKSEMPELFAAVPGGAPSGDPSGPPKPGGKAQPTGIEAGRERARAEHEASVAKYRSPFEGMQVIGGSIGGNHS